MTNPIVDASKTARAFSGINNMFRRAFPDPAHRRQRKGNFAILYIEIGP